MTEATEQVDAKQVSKAKALATRRAQDIDLLAQVEANPDLFATDAAKTLKARIADASNKFDSLPPSVRVKAMTPGQLNELVSGEMEKAVKAWYPEAFEVACGVVNIDPQLIASKDAGKHSVTIMGHYDHKAKRLVKRPQLQRLVTLSRKGVK